MKNRIIKYRAKEEETSFVISFYHDYEHCGQACFPTRQQKTYALEEDDLITITIRHKKKG